MADRTATTVKLQWLCIAILAILQLQSYGSRWHSGDPAPNAKLGPSSTASRPMRRSLQQIESPSLDSASDGIADPTVPAPEAPLAEEPAAGSTLPKIPSPTPQQNIYPIMEPITESTLSPIRAPTQEPATSPSKEPVPESISSPAPSPIPEPAPSCDCPPPTLPPEMAFLKDVLEWDEDRQALIINARTIDAAGHLIVNGFSGIRQSLFVGGDPNSGESATEISPGSILLYTAGQDAYPTIAGFQTEEGGYEVSSVEVMGGLQVLNPDTGDITVLGR